MNQTKFIRVFFITILIFTTSTFTALATGVSTGNGINITSASTRTTSVSGIRNTTGPVIELDDIYTVDSLPSTIKFKVSSNAKIAEVWAGYTKLYVNPEGFAIFTPEYVNPGINEYEVLAYDEYGNETEAKLLIEYLNPALFHSVVTSNGTFEGMKIIKIIVNSKDVTGDVPAVLMNGRTMVPLRFVSEALGSEVTWDEGTRTAYVKSKTQTEPEPTVTLSSEIFEGNKIVNVVVDNKIIRSDVPAVLKNGRTMVPLRFVSEALGAVVKWSASTETAYVKTTIPAETTLSTSEEPVLVTPESIIPVTPIISNVYELKAYLEENYSSLTTVLGKTTFAFNIYENDRTYNEWDYWIMTDFDLNYFPLAMSSIKYTDAQKNQLRQELKSHQEKMAKDIISLMPGKKIEGGYYKSWYRYPTIQYDLIVRRYFSWKNFDNASYTIPLDQIYSSVLPSTFRWYDFVDDKL